MPTPGTPPRIMPAASSPAPVSLATRGVIQVPSYHLENRGRVGADCVGGRRFRTKGIPGRLIVNYLYTPIPLPGERPRCPGNYDLVGGTQPRPTRAGGAAGAVS